MFALIQRSSSNQYQPKTVLLINQDQVDVVGVHNIQLRNAKMFALIHRRSSHRYQPRKQYFLSIWLPTKARLVKFYSSRN